MRKHRYLFLKRFRDYYVHGNIYDNFRSISLLHTSYWKLNQYSNYLFSNLFTNKSLLYSLGLALALATSCISIEWRTMKYDIYNFYDRCFLLNLSNFSRIFCNSLKRWMFKNCLMSSFAKLSNLQAAAKKKEGGGKRAQRATSNVLGAFPQQQMQEFKEVICEMSNFLLKKSFSPIEIVLYRHSRWSTKTGTASLTLKIWRTCTPPSVSRSNVFLKTLQQFWNATQFSALPKKFRF